MDMINDFIISENLLFKNRTIKSLSLHTVMKGMLVILFVKGQISVHPAPPSPQRFRCMSYAGQAKLAIPIKIKWTSLKAL